VCLATSSWVLPKPVRHIIRSKASSSKFQYLIFHSRPSSNCLRVPSRLLVLSVSPSIMCYTRQFLHKMWPIHLAFFRFILCRTFLSPLILCNNASFFHTISPYGLLNPSPAPYFKTYKVFPVFFPKRPSFCTIQSCAPNFLTFMNSVLPRVGLSGSQNQQRLFGNMALTDWFLNLKCGWPCIVIQCG